jgi:hypothetical protein|tara:strand:+ start:5789 stop:5962 length:174 start_codon:yes stop_codon:yes gene_type:complete
VDKKEKKPYLMTSPFHASREDKLQKLLREHFRCTTKQQYIMTTRQKIIAEEYYGYIK